MRVEVWFREEIGDGRATRVLEALRAGGVPDLRAVSIRDVYLVDGVPGLRSRDLVELVCDPVAQRASVRAAPDGRAPPWDLLLEVAARPGVTDPVATSLRGALRTVLGLPVPDAALVQTARQYLLQSSALRGGGLHAVPERAFGGLFNPLIQAALTIGARQWRDGRRPPRIYPAAGAARVPAAGAPRTVRFPAAAMSNGALAALSEERLLALSAAEMQAIRDYYGIPATRQRRRAAGVGEAATDVELEMLAQTWSEHCKHKIFNAVIEYRDGSGVETIDSLFDTCIRATTCAVDRGDGFLRSVFHDNSGVIEFDADTLLCFKAETHNSPSALDPYGGAITGIVGVNRDIIGTGRGARPIFNTNVLCFAPLDLTDVPAGLLPPRRVLDGVHRGIVDGGNQSGIPTVAGAVLFDASFVGKPLVFCGTGGILPARLHGEPSWEAEPRAGDRAVMVGGRIGRDGIHGATFSSLALDESSPLSAVQIGDPITQKKMADFLLEARDLGLYRAITDNGAGGLSSSFGEMAEACGGVRLELDRAPLKYQGLAPWEILVSESQERMSLAVPPEHFAALAELAARREVEVADLGEFTSAGTVELRYAGELVGLLDLQFLHHGLPRMKLRAVWQAPEPPAVDAGRTPPAPQEVLPRLLADPNIASKEPLVRQYDHEVQALTVGKPFVGRRMDGPGDGAVLRPRAGSTRAITVTHGICPWYSAHDAYHMAMCAVDEAVRAHVACGGDPERMAGLDNFCWPDPVAGPDNPAGEFLLAQLVRAARGLREACLAYRLPLVSGKDSMKNNAVVDGRRIAVLPTLLVSVLGIMADLRSAPSTDFKRPGDLVYLVGDDRGELGATAYARLLAASGAALPIAERQRHCPTVDAPAAMRRYTALHRAIAAGWVNAAHDVSDGGLAVALAECAIGGRLGARIDLARVPAAVERIRADGAAHRRAGLLFSESGGRIVVTVPSALAARVDEQLRGLPCAAVGEVTGDDRLTVLDGGEPVAAWPVAALVRAWKTPI
ncbi:MAG: AIR synthase-related protein, partial [Spirochaetaceae bacterium]|nr:AIR synthase-related protein [Spirochaetaceae bacterium]